MIGLNELPQTAAGLRTYRPGFAPMESVFHTLKVELAHQRRWPTRDQARRDLFAFIEGYDNRKRIHGVALVA